MYDAEYDITVKFIRESEYFEALAKSVVHNIFALAGVTPAKKTDTLVTSRPSLKKSAVKVYIQIRNRTFDTLTTDLFALSSDIDSDIRYCTNMQNVDWLTGISTVSVASCLAWFCSEQGIYWDDTKESPKIVKAFLETPLGAALHEAGCFTSQIK